MLRRFAATLAALGLLASLVTPTYSFGGSPSQPFTWVSPRYTTQYGSGNFTTNLTWAHEESWMQHAYGPNRLWDLAC